MTRKKTLVPRMFTEQIVEESRMELKKSRDGLKWRKDEVISSKRKWETYVRVWEEEGGWRGAG